MAWVDPILEAGIRAHSAHRLEEARRFYERAFARDPNNVVALVNLGLLLGEQREYPRAEELLRRALAIAPRHVAGWLNLAVVLYDQKKYAEAIECCEKGLKLAPRDRRLQNTLIANLIGAERYEEARARLVATVAAHPQYAQGWQDLGTVQAKLGRLEEAAESFLRAAKLDPRDVAARVGAGDCLLVLGCAGEALEQLDAALKLQPWEVRALALKTLALAELGRSDEERWLSDPHRLVHRLGPEDFGCSAEEIAALNRELSEFAAAESSMRKDPAEYATVNALHSTRNLVEYDHPAIAKLCGFIARGFEARRRRLKEEDPTHPFVRAAPHAYRLDLWAVRQSAGGRMHPHIHIAGWLSGVYYVQVPAVVNDPTADHAGWIKFGAPRLDIRLSREPIIRTVKPEPGTLLTFPSYLWHDTVPLPADIRENRLCFSFDCQPAG